MGKKDSMRIAIYENGEKKTGEINESPIRKVKVVNLSTEDRRRIEKIVRDRMPTI